MVQVEEQPLLKDSTGKLNANFLYKYIQFLPFVIFYHTGLGMNYYVISEWIQHYEQTRIFSNETANSSSECGLKNKSDPNYALYEIVESETSKWQMFANLGWYIPAIISTSVLPAYSDCFGRRFILILGSIGTCFKLAVATLVIYFNLHPMYISFASIIEGCTGSYFSVTSGCYSFVADLTEIGRRRTLGLTIFDGTFLICITLSGLGTGYFIQLTGYVIPIATCCGLTAVSNLLAVTIVPETFPKHMRSKSRSCCVVFKRTFAFYFSDIFREKRCAYVLLLTAFVLEKLAMSHRTGLEMIYQLGRPFCWSLGKIGLFSASRNFAQGFSGLFLAKPLQMCFSDLNIAILSLTFGTGSFVLESMARTDLMMYMVPLSSALAYLCDTMIKSLMSTITPPDKQGSLFSSIVLTQVLCNVAANFLFNTVYAKTVSFMSGFVFLLLAGLCLLALVVLVIFSMTRRSVLNSETTKSINISEG